MTLDIFGMKIKVVYDDMSAANLCGVFIADQKKIVIDDQQTKEQQMQSLIHEVIHSISYRQGWCQVVSKETEEFICEHISTALCENFKLTKKK